MWPCLRKVVRSGLEVWVRVDFDARSDGNIRVEHSRQNRPILKPKSLRSKLNCD